ncbi:MAG TPA: aldolase/citrate lyase family protein [Synergistales bacterium]|nr:aldolase/citrate lyase family protein [Synergistales bacterium]
MINTLKRKLECGQAVVGPFLTLNCPDLVELMGLTGFDFLIIDTEHGPMEAESIQNLIRAAELRGITPIVRVSDTRDVTILKTLDVGAHGIQVPQVNSREAAESVVRSAKYFPAGTRGAAMPRASHYGLLPLDDYLASANRETMVIVHCENRAGLSCIEEIASTPEVDVVFVGPYDLSQSLGFPGKVGTPQVAGAVDRALKAAQGAGKPAGIFVTSTDEARMRLDQGFRYIAYSMDSLLFAGACSQAVKALKAHLGCKVE